MNRPSNLAADEADYQVGTVVRSAKNVWYRRVTGHGDLMWEIVATGDKHGDRVFKGALRDDAHPVRPLTVVDEPS